MADKPMPHKPATPPKHGAPVGTYGTFNTKPGPFSGGGKGSKSKGVD